MFGRRYGDEELFFSSIKVINPEYQGDPELDRAIWKHNIGLIGEPKEYTYPAVLCFDGERYTDLVHKDRNINEEDSPTSFSIEPVYVIDFKVPASKYCRGRFSRSGAYKAFDQHMHKFDIEYKAFKQNRENKQRVKK